MDKGPIHSGIKVQGGGVVWITEVNFAQGVAQDAV